MSAPLIQATGRRKSAVARVRIRPGKGVIVINGRPVENYFPSETHRMQFTEPLRVTQTEDVYDIDVTLHGGGLTGQAGALSSYQRAPDCEPAAESSDMDCPARV